MNHDFARIRPHRSPAPALGGAVICRRPPDRPVHFRLIDDYATFQSVIEKLERLARHLHRARRPGYGYAVAAADQGDSQLLFDSRQILVMLSEQQRQQAVVVELQLDWAHLRGWLGARRFQARIL